MTLTIVKLGGSLLGSVEIDAWLAEILAWGGPAVIVPGGGSFAEHVRQQQAALGFDDTTAHRLALLAMDQVAVLLASRWNGLKRHLPAKWTPVRVAQTRQNKDIEVVSDSSGSETALVLAATPAEVTGAVARGRIAVWLPAAMVLADSDIPRSWDVTSDSLAAWLAGRLGAERLLLVKSRDVDAPVTAHDLAGAGIVDPLFPLYAQKCGATIFVAGPASLANASDVLQRGGMPGVAVSLDPTSRS